MTALVVAEAVSYRAGGRLLVDGVSLAVARGEMVVIAGPNGAGKSTLMRLLCGELAPASGAVRYGAEPLATLPAWRLAGRRAVLPQASRLAFPFRVREVARIGLDGIGRGLTRPARQAIVARALAEADLTELAERNYQTLSGGEQQRAQFARVLCQLEAGRTLSSDQVLFLDEPIASLDLRHQLALLDAAARRARAGLAVVAVLHDLNLAAAYADSLVVMDAGRVVEAGRPSAVLSDRLLAEVFGVSLGVGRVPPDGQAFVLPERPSLEPFQV